MTSPQSIALALLGDLSTTRLRLADVRAQLARWQQCVAAGEGVGAMPVNDLRAVVAACRHALDTVYGPDTEEQRHGPAPDPC